MKELNSNAVSLDAFSQIDINVLKNESIVNNPGDIDQETLEYLHNLTENLIYSTCIDEQPKSNRKIKIILNVQIQPIDNQNPETGDSTKYSNYYITTNKGVKIIDGIINSKINQILIFHYIHYK